MPALCRLLTIALFVSLASGTHAARFIPLGVLHDGDVGSRGVDISADGKVVTGVNYPLAGDQTGTEPFRWTEETGMVGLGRLHNGRFSESTAISADGSIIVGGGYYAPVGEAFRWTEASGMVGLGHLSYRTNPTSGASGISADGSVIVGGASGGNSKYYSVRWTEQEGIVSLGDAPGGRNSYAIAASADGSVIVGTFAPPFYSQDGGTEAYRWTQSTGMVGLGDLPSTRPDAPLLSSATDVSADGTVVVGISGGNQTQKGFRWTSQDGMLPLAALIAPEYGSQAFGVSADGSVIVGASGLCAVRWAKTDEPESVADLLAAAGVDVGDWQLREARAVSANGNVIVGWGYGPSGEYRGWIADLSTEIPEPSSIILVFAGIALFGIASRNRQRNQ